MSEYWKSTPKKFCDFCKCWIADNKPSIDFHEKGKNHQENVKKRLAEIKKSTAKKRKQEETFMSDFAAIEAAALKAVQKDFKADPSRVGQSDVKAVIAASNASVPQQSNESHVTTQSSAWTVCQAPTGHTYYYNSKTGVSSWEMPEELKSNQQSSASGHTHTGETAAQISKEVNEPQTEEKSLTPVDCHPLLGGWTAVNSYEETQVSESTEKTSTAEEQSATVEASNESSEQPADTSGIEAAVSKSRGLRFKEKTLKVPLSDETDPPVAFKKRKGTQHRSIRKREDED